MSPRDMFFLQVGLRASHIEEAIAAGDFERAKAHYGKLEAMIANFFRARPQVR